MNKQRRKDVDGIIDILSKLKDSIDLTQLTKLNEDFSAQATLVKAILNEEQDSFDNLSEGLQSSKEDKHQQTMDYLEAAHESLAVLPWDGESELDDVEIAFDDAINNLEEAKAV